MRLYGPESKRSIPKFAEISKIMEDSESVEHATLLQCTAKLVGGISQDPLVVSNELLEAGLTSRRIVSAMLLPGKDNYDKSTELVLHVIGVVENSPKKFEVFINILRKFQWLDYLVELLEEEYEAIKSKTESEV